MFVVPKHIAHKMVITGTSVSQKAFSNFQKLQPKTNQAKNLKKSQKNIAPFTIKKLHHFQPKNS